MRQRNELALLLSKNVGIEKARELVEAAANELGVGAEINVNDGLRILEHVAVKPGIIGISARFAMTHVLLRWQAAPVSESSSGGGGASAARAASAAVAAPTANAAAASRPARQPSEEASTTGRKPLVLAVDDSPASLQIFKIQMTHHGFEVETCASPPDAVAAVTALRPEIVMLDVHMPNIDGFELCKRIRQLPRAAELVICFLTTSTSEDGSRRGAAAGADCFFRKPYQAADLASQLRGLLASRRRSRH